MRKADSTAVSSARLVEAAIREIRGELATLAQDGDLARSADCRERAYAAIRQRMARLERRLRTLQDANAQDANAAAERAAEGMTGLEVRHSPSRAKAICELVTGGQGENLAAVFTDRMSRTLVDRLREATVAAFRASAVAGGSLKETADDMAERWAEAARRPVRFVDASGREWEGARYFQMNARTNAMRIYNDTLADALGRTTGSDLVRVSRGGDPDCDACRAWEGAILSLSGKTAGLPTYETARRAGCFHPNCTHTLEAVDEDADADEIARQRGIPFSDAASQADRAREIAVSRRMDMDGLGRGEAELAEDRDALASAIRHGLVRADAEELVAKMTDAQVRALCAGGRVPSFAPVKRIRGGTRTDPKFEPERWVRGSRGGVVHLSRDADAAHLLEVCGVGGAKPGTKGAWKPTTPLERATDALMQSIGARHTDKPLGIETVNPNYGMTRTELHKRSLRDDAYTSNCQRCVPTWEATRRGYAVTALPYDGKASGADLSRFEESSSMFKGGFAKRVYPLRSSRLSYKSSVEALLKKWGDGARAEISIFWNDGGGHVFAAEQVNGKTVYFDPQDHRADASRYFQDEIKGKSKRSRMLRNLQYVLRIDNLEFTEVAKRCFKRVE